MRKQLKKNLFFSIIIGEAASWFLIFVIKNPQIPEFQQLAAMKRIVWTLPVVFPLFFVIGFLIGEWLSKFWRVFRQIVRFGETGVLNTFIDFGILNLLIGLTGITKGLPLAPLNTFSFLAATVNSYFWNKFWTFEKKTKVGTREFLRFAIITAIGWCINTGIVVLGTKYIEPFTGLSPGAWVNVMKIFATSLSMVWNFSGYKFIVFKK